MTIPTLMHKYYEIQTVSKLKETYSILLQAIKLAGEDEETGLPEDWGLTGRNTESSLIVAEKLKPFLKIAVDCGQRDTSNKCWAAANAVLNGRSSNISSDSRYYFVALLNGASIAFYGGEMTNDIYMYALIDTNGIAKPNVWGRDIFEFTYRGGGLGLLPSGNPQNSSNTYEKYCNSTTHKGFGCAYYVITFGNMDYLKR